MTDVANNTPDSSPDVESATIDMRLWHGGKLRRKKYGIILNLEEFAPYPEFEKLTYFNEMTLIRRAQGGDLGARNEMWVRNLRLVYAIINEFHVPPDMTADALQEGAIGIKRAIEKFDLERYGAFSTYAWAWVWQRIQSFLHRRVKPCRVPAQLTQQYARFRQGMSRAATEAETEVVLATWKEREPNVFSRLLGIYRISTPIPLHLLPEAAHPVYEDLSFDDTIDRAALIATALPRLPERERTVITRRFGLDGDPEETLEQLGSRFCVTRERIRQIESSGLRRLERYIVPDAPGASPRLVESPCHEVFGTTLPVAASGPDAESDPVYSLPFSEQTLMIVLGWLSFSEANAVIYYFGLLRTPKIPVEEIAELLELTNEQTLHVVNTGVKKLLDELKHFKHDTFGAFATLLKSQSNQCRVF